MENRDRDKMSQGDSSPQSDDVNREKNDSESSFGQNIGRSSSWDKEPSRSGGGSSSDLGEESDVSSSRSGSRSSSGMTEH